MIDDHAFRQRAPGGWVPAPDWLRTPESLLDELRTRTGRIAVDDGRRSFTYPELADAAARLARQWHAWGLEARDSVAIFAPNSAAWAIAQLASALCGAVVVPINVRARPAELVAILEGTRPRIVVLADRFMTNPMQQRLEQAVDALDANHAPELLVVLDDSSDGGLAGWSIDQPSRSDRASVEAGGSTAEPFIAFWTSGTTGRPKSVIHGWHGLLSSVWDWSSMLGFGREDCVVVATRPFYYIAGNAVQLMGSLICGAKLVLEPTLAPDRILAAIREYQGTHLLGGPHFHEQMLAALGSDPAPESLRTASIGGDPPAADLVVRLREQLGITTVVQTYGMTELHGFVTTTLPEDPPERMARDAGICLPGVSISIRDEHDAEVADGEAGAIKVRGRAPWGHYADGVPSRIEPASWFPTGDLGRISAQRLSVVGRVDGLMKVSGERVHVDDVEATMRTWPELREVLVFAVPDDERVAVVGAAVELTTEEQPAPADVEAIVARAHEELSPPKRPRVLRIVPSGWNWPRNVAGKMRRGEAQALLEGHDGVRSIDLREADWSRALVADTAVRVAAETDVTG